VRYFEHLAANGDPADCLTYAFCLEGAMGHAVDNVKADHFFKLAADARLAGAEYAYGERLVSGKLTREDPGTGLLYLTRAADQGLPIANCELGSCARRAGNDAVAWWYFKLAADGGHMMGCFSYAEHLCDGRGVPRDIEESKRQMRMAADLGHPAAQWICALDLRDDLTRAARYLRLGAAAGGILRTVRGDHV
jgi:TPR repeat protein